jgi:2-polyprenyl-6-methoxyphenol hydroxylase-like FAD-dependent oxidoreductase
MGLQVAVIGGGIGGLSAALAMLKAGCDVQVYEQAAKFGEIGAGINGAGMTAAPCNVLRWGRRSMRRSAPPTIISIAAISRRCWPPRCPGSARMPATAWSASRIRASA